MASLNLLPQLFATTVVNGQAVLNQAATGSATNDSAEANASTPTAIGIQSLTAGDGLISIGAAGSVVGRSSGSQSAIAGSTNGGSDANASIGQAIGINQLSGDSIAVGSVGSILGTVELSQLSRATSVAASANADAITAAAYGIDFDPVPGGSIRTGGDGSVQGLVQLNTSAVATTTGNAANDGATALQQLSDAAGVELTGAAGPSIVIGGLGEVVGAVAVSGSATATASAQGNSSATAGTLDPVAGVVGTLSGLRTTAASPAVQVAGDASLNGSVLADFSATATSVLGAAEAAVDGSAMAVGDSVNLVGGQISVGADGVYNASADLTSIARAGTTNGDATARIAPNGQVVIGTALDGAAGTVGLSIGGDGRISSSATARQVGSSATTNGSATTSFDGVGPSTIQGINTTDIAIGGSTSGIDATAVLIANGSATAVLGSATVEAPNAHRTAGFDFSALSVAGAANGGIRASGDAAMQLIAQSTNGDATATAFAGATAETRGISLLGNSAGILISSDVNRLDADARQTIRMAASSVNGNLAQSSLGDMISFGIESGAGAADGVISIGGSGILDITSTNVVDLSASNVGSLSSNGDATAQIVGGSFASEAAREIGITIADQGLIQATATSAGRLAAQSVNGNALATVVPVNSFTTVGIVSGGQSISAGADGDIQAAARMHGIGGTNTPYLLQATSTAGNADASFAATGDIATIGITSFSNSGQTINAGTATGNINADATGGAALYATSTGGNATANFGLGTSRFAGIVDSDMRAGSAGSNRVAANAALNVLLDAQTVSGTAEASGSSAVYGITDGFAPSTGGNTVQLAGDISAQARFSNTALARSVQGAATSTANNANVLGVNQYDLTLIGSGSLTGGAQGLMRADARTVSGTAQSNAVL